MKVLYVDEKRTWHTLFEKVLSLRGAEILHAYSFREGINMANTEKPDVIVVDYKISGIPVTEFIEDFKSTGIPLIVVGYKFDGLDRDSLLSQGVAEVLEKPFDVKSLISALSKVKELAPEFKKEEKLEIVTPGGEEIPVVNLDEEEEETLEVLPSESKPEEVPVEPAEVLKRPQPEEVKEEKREEVVPSISVDKKEVERIIREVVWEVVPELAEKIIREEIKKLIESRLA